MFPITYITRADMRLAADRLDVTVAVIQAVTAIEARRSGFIKGTDLPAILFEGHKFSGFTGGAYDASHPAISYPRWTKAHYRGGKGEYGRLKAAIAAHGDPDPALKSASWGMFQIMGFNHAAAGHVTVRDFVNDMALGEDRHLAAFVGFIESNGLADELRSENWRAFARAYNGPGYRTNRYDTKLAQAFAGAVRQRAEEVSGAAYDLERGDAVALQVALNLQTDAGLVTDGWIGPATRGAIRAFQTERGLAPSGVVDADLSRLLNLDVSAYAKEG